MDSTLEEEHEDDEIARAARSFQERRGRRRAAGRAEVSEAFLEHVRTELLKSSPIPGEELCAIYPVPPEFRDSYKDVGKFYKPKFVSIGPYHRGRHEKPLIPMQDHKWTCLHKLISEHQTLDESHEAPKVLRRCLNKMIQQEASIRELYSKDIALDDENLALRMLLDGGFILYLLLKEADIIKAQADDVQHVVGRVWIWRLVRYDLLLLENQIPFFVIRDLCNILVPDSRDINLVDTALRYFSSLNPCRKQAQYPFYIPENKVLHLLHLVYLSVLPCSQYYKHNSHNPPSEQWIPSATELKDSGVEFKKRMKENEGSFLSFLDIKFNDGVMEIPQLRLHDYSVSLFRNLIAFEQCYPGTECHVTAYAALMNCLIDKEEDMRLLHLDQILVGNITTEQDATMFFKRLCNETYCSPGKNYLGGLINDVIEHHGNPWHQNRAYIFRTYFSNRVATIAVLFGFIVAAISAFSNIVSIKKDI